MTKPLPIAAVVITKNEAPRLPHCLSPLVAKYAQILVVDSGSTDDTVKIAHQHGATVVPFMWNGHYPKKKQYCLEALTDHIEHDWIFLLDADEYVTPDLTAALRTAFAAPRHAHHAGYFIRGRYVWNGHPLKHGLQNNKLALVNRKKVEFPVINDLDIVPGMGEVEGHYQPVLTAEHSTALISQITPPLLHDACHSVENWRARHARYAHWEDEMDRRNAWPSDPHPTRKLMKALFRKAPPWVKACLAFTHSYIVKAGILDGENGLTFAKLRAAYYWR